MLYNQLGRLTPQDLVRILTAYSAAAQHSPAAYSQELYAAATEFLWESLGQLEPCALADVAAAYAAVQHYDDDEDFFNGLVQAALQRLQVSAGLQAVGLLSTQNRIGASAPQQKAGEASRS